MVFERCWIEKLADTHKVRMVKCPVCAGNGWTHWKGAWHAVTPPPLQECGMCGGSGTAKVVRR